MTFIPLALSLAGGLAPFMTSFLKGPKAEKVAGKIVKIAQHISGVDAPREVEEKIKSQIILKHQFKKAMLHLKKELAYLQDRQDARRRDMAFLKTSKGNVRADLMVVSAALGLMLCLGFLALYSDKLPGEAIGILSTVAGIFGACLKDAYSFEFGSSRGSKEKDSALKTLVDCKASPYTRGLEDFPYY
jgi:hypothetical protein